MRNIWCRRLASIKQFSGRAVDVWALGVTLYSLIYNELPFWAESDLAILEVIHKTELKLEGNRRLKGGGEGVAANVSEGLRQLVLRMLEKDPAKRITVDELKANQWVNEGYLVPLSSKELAFQFDMDV